jgi:hypothetical protein
LFAYGIFKTIYSPIKAFKEVLQNPKYYGPLLIMILFMAANTGFFYLRASKTYDEQILPAGATVKDEWTESKIWWTSNATISESNDSLNSGYYGSKSIEFSVTNGKQIGMQLNFNESVVCSGVEGYKNVSFWVKTIYPNTTDLTNATLYLLTNQTSYFSHILATDSFPSNDTIWNKLNILLGPEDPSGWTVNGAANWSNITSLMVKFVWSENANLTVRIDGLFFRGVFRSTAEIYGASDYVLAILLSSLMQFVITWVILGGLVFLLTKGLGAKTLWKASLIIIGFALITLFIQSVANVATVASWPQLYATLEYFGGAEGETQIAQNRVFDQIILAYQINEIVLTLLLVWTIALCAIAVHVLTEFSWTKSALVAIVAYVITNVVVSFIIPT